MTVANSSSKIIYADNAATTKIDDEALNLMIDLQKNFFVNPSSAYKLSRPLKKILKESREKIFHMDAVQAVGHIPIDVKLLDVDMLSASAHKFNDPKGIGFLYVRDELKILPYIDGGGQEFLKRAGTENVPAIAAMVLALEKNCRAMKRNAEKLSDVSKILLDCLNGVDFILNGGKNRLPGHLSLSFKNCEGETLMHRLDLKNIYVATGLACNS